MSTKHFVTDIDKLVVDALESLALTNPDLAFYKADKIITNKNHDGSKNVAVISGGGAGHEPAHAAFVGNGLLTAAASGWIFASPSVAQIGRTIDLVSGSKGVLLIIKNYTGDVFHFRLAAEKAKSKGTNVEVVVVGDDVAVGRTKSGKVGRRGLAGTVLVHKVAGAAASDGKLSLHEVAALAQEVANNLVTVGVSLNHVHIPGRKVEEENLIAEDEAELGLGIHNEKGAIRLKPIPAIKDLINTILDQLLDQNDKERAYVDFKDAENVVLLVNNLGGLSPVELGAITTEVFYQLAARGIRPVRLLSGTYMTSLDGPGFSVTLLKAKSHILPLLDLPTKTTGFAPVSVVSDDLSSRINDDPTPVINHSENEDKPKPEILDTSLFIFAVTEAAKRVIASEPELTKYDTVVGDGDCGFTFKRAAEAAAEFVKTSKITPNVYALSELAKIVENNMDGTSGAIFSIFLHALATAVSDVSNKLDAAGWAKAAKNALDTLYKATPARPGDRTLVDALDPFISTLLSTSDVRAAASAARKGALNTKGLAAGLGRAVYVDNSVYDRVPDPGAVGIAELVEGLAAGLDK
ncbi:Dak1 domain-containing protein [Lipomyces japonicus]|uniref:Dak1 domain-containing protein n=1 Tax=Lipomyces japonicus TaxID=56871 RepID=UPI0034CF5B4C